MAQYRVYRLNPAGKIVSGDWIEAESDAQAGGLAHALCDAATPTVELWQGDRQVAVIPCDEPLQAAAGRG